MNIKNFKINGSSMEPILHNGDNCLVALTTDYNPEINDIVLFDRLGINITHRIIYKLKFNSKVYYIEKGDNFAISSIVDDSEIKGKVLVDNSKNHDVSYYYYNLIRKKIIVFCIKKMQDIKKNNKYCKKYSENKIINKRIFVYKVILPTLIYKDKTSLLSKIRCLKKNYKNFWINLEKIRIKTKFRKNLDAKSQ